MCVIGSNRQEDLSALLIVTGYFAKKTMLRMKCEACKQKFSNRDLHQLNLNSILLFLFILFSVHTTGLMFVFQSMKKISKVVNHKQTLLRLFEKHITSIDFFSDHLLVCDVCKVELITNVMQSLSCFANILLKHYSIAKKILKFKIVIVMTCMHYI